MPYMYALYVNALYVGLICMPRSLLALFAFYALYVHALYALYVNALYVHALYVGLICMPRSLGGLCPAP